MVEANALSEALAESEWVTSWLLHARDFEYDARKRQTLNREIKITSVMREPESELKELLAITDAKSMYDNLNREQYAGAEKRAALEILVIRDSLESMDGVCKWVPHEENPVDCMSKMRGNATRMLEMFRKASYRLTAEEEVLEERRQYREATGQRNPRPSTQTEGLADTRRHLARKVVSSNRSAQYHQRKLASGTQSSPGKLEKESREKELRNVSSLLPPPFQFTLPQALSLIHI